MCHSFCFRPSRIFQRRIYAAASRCLQTGEFLYETSLFPELEYTFKHALTHEVAYSGLLQDRRRGLHGRIVEAIEKLYSDRLAEQAELLAHHAFRGEIWEKAVTYLRQAGVKAAGRSADREAVACFDLALNALQHLPQNREALKLAVDLRLEMRPWLRMLGEQARVIEQFGEAESLAEELGDKWRLAHVLADSWRSLFLARRRSSARYQCRRTRPGPCDRNRRFCHPD